MIKSMQNSSKTIVLALIIMIGASGCKSTKKLAAAKEKERMEQEASLRLKQQQEAEAEAKRKGEEEKMRAEALAKEKEMAAKASTPKTRLSEYFYAIASSANATSANNSINEALTMFASPETPLLIVISESGGQKDYDRPTTIKDYLNYLKDQKKNINTITDLKLDNAGKITEVELRKNL
jgi:hypothetical protein